MLTGVSVRDLDPAEIYYEVVDRIWPTNGMCLLEFDRLIDAEQVRAAWATTTARVPVVRARVERSGGRDARIVFSADDAPAPVATYDDVPTALALESGTWVELDHAPLARCAQIDHDGRTSLVLAVHHAVLDGRGIVQLALFLAHVLAGAEVSGHPLELETLPLGGFAPTQPAKSRLEMLATARELRAEDGFVGNAEAPSWHDPSLDADRDIGWIIFELSADESRALIDWSRANGTTVQGTLSAAVLQTVKTLSPQLSRLGLTAAVDLRARVAPPEAGFIGQAAALIAASYDVTAPPAELARTVSADLRRRVERGEGELFFALSGVERLPVGEATDEVVRRWTAGATPTICFSNLGVVPGPAPAGLRAMTLGLVPTPNQIVFIAATTYAGQIFFSMAYDRNRLSIDAESIVGTLRHQLVTLPR